MPPIEVIDPYVLGGNLESLTMTFIFLSITSVRLWHKTRLFLPTNNKSTCHLITKKTQMLLKHRIKANDPPIFHENLVLPHLSLRHVKRKLTTAPAQNRTTKA